MSPDWIDQVVADHPQAHTISIWLLELYEGRDVSTFTPAEHDAIDLLTNTLFELGSRYSPGGRTL